MKILTAVIVFLALCSCAAAPAVAPDMFDGLTVEEYVDRVYDNPDPEKIAEQEAYEAVSDAVGIARNLLMRWIFWPLP